MPTSNKSDVANEIPNLWPVDQIRVDVLTPLAILRRQATKLNEISRGLLKAEIATTATDTRISHSLDIIAPVIGYRESLLTVTHDKGFVYPATLEISATKKDEYLVRRDRKIATVEALAKAKEREVNMFIADSQATLIQTLGEFLKSGYVISALQSLLAQSNDANREEFSSEAA